MHSLTLSPCALPDPVCTGIPLGDLAKTCRVHWNTTGRTVTAHTHQAHIVKQSSINASLKWQDGGTPTSKWTGICKFSFCLELTALQWIPNLLKHVSTSTLLCACLWYERHYSFLCMWGCKSNEISLPQTTLTIPVVYIRGCMLGSDLT